MFFTTTYNNEKLIAMLKSHSEAERNVAIKYFYTDKNLRATVKNLVLMQGGDESDSDDVFQECLILLDNNVRNNNFKGQSTLRTYFVSMCKWKWYSMKRSTRRVVLMDDNSNMDSDLMESPEVLMLSEEKKSIVLSLLEKLEDKCRQILELYQLDYSMDEIAEQVGFLNVQSAKNAAANCRKKFRSLLETNVELMATLKTF